MSAALAEAHERAVSAAVSYLEREACWTRRGRGGAERVRGGRLRGGGVQAPAVPRQRSAAAHACRRREPGARRRALHGTRRARAVRARVGGGGGVPRHAPRRGAGAVAVGVLAAGRARAVRDRRCVPGGVARVLAAAGRDRGARRRAGRGRLAVARADAGDRVGDAGGEECSPGRRGGMADGGAAAGGLVRLWRSRAGGADDDAGRGAGAPVVLCGR